MHEELSCINGSWRHAAAQPLPRSADPTDVGAAARAARQQAVVVALAAAVAGSSVCHYCSGCGLRHGLGMLEEQRLAVFAKQPLGRLADILQISLLQQRY